jgi:hypothetical protein
MRSVRSWMGRKLGFHPGGLTLTEQYKTVYTLETPALLAAGPPPFKKSVLQKEGIVPTFSEFAIRHTRTALRLAQRPTSLNGLDDERQLRILLSHKSLELPDVCFRNGMLRVRPSTRFRGKCR